MAGELQNQKRAMSVRSWPHIARLYLHTQPAASGSTSAIRFSILSPSIADSKRTSLLPNIVPWSALLGTRLELNVHSYKAAY